MTIKEIEQLSGMTRANIRYYETEGLLTPYRADNGYRDYSPDDLQTLQRIRLLRSLGMSIEDIKAVRSGRLTLSASLYQLEQELSRTQSHLEWAQETCRVMRQDNVTYETLDANRYNNRLPAPTADTAPIPVYAPWRRFFARAIDAQLYHTIIVGAVAVLFSVRSEKISDLNLLWSILGLLMMGLLEPIWLHFFGTTPGKWLLGLSITDLDGCYPDMQTARSRTWGVLWWGKGLEIPIFSLIRHWKSYRQCQDGETLHWEYETTQTLDTQKPWKDAVAAVAYVAMLVVLVLALQSNDTVPHRGDLTAAQFCENYNAMADYYDMAGHLQTDGTFTSANNYGNGVVVEIAPSSEYVEFTVEDGVLRSVTATFTAEGSIMGPQEGYTTVLILAAVKSRVSALSSAGEKAVKAMMKLPLEDLKTMTHGIHVSREWDYGDYHPAAGGLLFIEGEEAAVPAVMTLTVTFGEE